MNITPVLAESHNDFRRFIYRQNLNIGHFAYVSSKDQLRGYKGCILTVGSFWSNPRYLFDVFNLLEQMSRLGYVSVIKGV